MIFSDTGIPDVLVVELEKRQDARGYFARAWCEREFAGRGLPRFVQTNMSMCGRKGTIRGLHYQASPHAEAKYLRCIRGAVYDVVADIRAGSPTFGRWLGVELSAENRRAVFVPDGLAHAYQALTAEAEVLYCSSAYYRPEAERGIRWNDPAFGIEWPVDDVTVSEKDSRWPDFAA